MGSAVGLLLSCDIARAQLPSFPGADGAGGAITGGRGGIVYHVTKLDQNYNDNVPGTLRYGLSDGNFPAGTHRTIVFDVAGTFWLGRFGADRGHNNGWDTQSRLNLGSNVTIAGQSAPGPVNIMGGVVKANGNNMIIRNVTIAPGYGMRNFEKPDENPPELPQEGDFPDSYVYDALDISGKGILIDHVTTLYATDETISANEQADDVTIQYSNISQGQNYPQADAEANSVRYTGHGLGSLLQAGSNAQISVLNNLYAHQKGRLPRVGSEQGTGAFNDFRNNVFYNWFGTAGSGGSGQPSFNNFIGNFYLVGPGGDDVSQLAGPDGRLNTLDDIGIVVQRSAGSGTFSGDSVTRIHPVGNVRDSNRDGDADDAIGVALSGLIQTQAYNVPAGATLSAQDAFLNVLQHMGARWWQRDYDPLLGNVAAIDTPDERLVHETYTGTGKIMAWADDPFNDDPNEGVEWRELLSYRADTGDGSAPFSRTAGWDLDDDGMPGVWEQAHGLNPNVANNNQDFDNDGYTDLEEYLNDVAAWPAPGPVVWTGGIERYAEIGNWRVFGIAVNVQGQGSTTTESLWQPSRYDDVRIAAGSVLVDSVGQHAGMLTIAPTAGDTASLEVNSGWLRAQTAIVVGGDTGAEATLTLSGGQLFTPLLAKGEIGSFELTGGTLTAEVVGFDLQVNGGRLAPATIGQFDVEAGVVTVANEIGPTLVMGDLEVLAGELVLQLAGAGLGEYDRVLVDQTLTAGGTLAVSLLDGFVPSAGDVFDLFDFADTAGSFALNLPLLADGLYWDASALLADGVLAVEFGGNADFDGNGRVDAGDFLVWQRGLGLNGQTDNSLGDATGDGVVDGADLKAWRAFSGIPANGSFSAVFVPEPATWLSVIVTFCLGAAGSRLR